MHESYVRREASIWLDWLIELVALAALLVPAWYLMQVWPNLPDSVPTHFNAAGVPDAFGGKSRLWWLMIVQAALWATLTAAQFIPVGYLNLVTIKVTAENRDHLRIVMRRGLGLMKAVVIVTFAVLSYGSVRLALGQTQGLPAWPMVLLFLGVFPVIIWMMVAVQRTPATTR